ncbi:BRO-N domain-containing protein [Pseudomonas zeae]|jgi:prophage antirepressor-like protein|uniref:Bro-N domain-containing protein n=1 Tax=Pseudomonas zeae TaxID=2745510 RepID=A0ABU5BJX1_9PSED|nr:Bro-N domain-containing protein [Pseudomonas zeae]MDX9676960.1 Bro-N domain-containing protein [Pseudomonas zeae]
MFTKKWLLPPTTSEDDLAEPIIPTTFKRHGLYLHGLLVENQPWFCARDIGRLMGVHLSERMVNKLDKDQRRVLSIEYFRQPEKQLMLSESGVYALLVYHYVPGNRLLREWLTHQVVPALRDAEHSGHSDRPMLSLLDWPEMSLSLLHWQNEDWIRLRDMPYLLSDQTPRKAMATKPWWRRVAQAFQASKHSMG